jgi:hypothetical protein
MERDTLTLHPQQNKCVGGGRGLKDNSSENLEEIV